MILWRKKNGEDEKHSFTYFFSLAWTFTHVIFVFFFFFVRLLACCFSFLLLSIHIKIHFVSLQFFRSSLFSSFFICIWVSFLTSILPKKIWAIFPLRFSSSSPSPSSLHWIIVDDGVGYIAVVYSLILFAIFIPATMENSSWINKHKRKTLFDEYERLHTQTNDKETNTR